MNNFFKNPVCFFILSCLWSCQDNSDNQLETGIWRATLKTSSGAEIPFNFEVTDSANQKYLDVINGNERFRVNEISKVSDSVNIQMPLFDSEIKAKIKGGGLYTENGLNILQIVAK